MSRSVWRGVVVCGLVLALAGCGGDGKAEPSSTSIELQGGRVATGPEQTLALPPTETATAGPGATATAGPPEMPAVAKTNTKEGAEAYASWFVTFMNYAQRNPTTTFLPKAEPGCKGCLAAERAVVSLANEGMRLSGDRATIDGVETFEEGVPRIINVHVKENPVDVISDQGKRVRSLSAGAGIHQVSLRWRSGEWSIVELSGSKE